jgi:Putative peptidoglycan binding domain/L,D-transpeptidase catalytic domain
MSRIISFGSKDGPDIGAVQGLLNGHNPTRLPRLSVDNNYGVFTTARVMEFQHQQGLEPDGACGPLTHGRLARGVTVPANPAGRCIVVDLILRNRAHAFLNGDAVFKDIPCHGGSASDPTTRGVFSIDSARRFRHHTSAEFPEPPDNMQFALFFHGGEAIHLGPPDEPSHGCVHVGLPGAEQLFHFAGSQDVMVIIVKRHKR